MFADLMLPSDIDAALNWPLGRASHLARLNKIPHYRLPDGSIRLRWEEVASLVVHVTPPAQLLPLLAEVLTNDR